MEAKLQTHLVFGGFRVLGFSGLGGFGGLGGLGGLRGFRGLGFRVGLLRMSRGLGTLDQALVVAAGFRA